MTRRTLGAVAGVVVAIVAVFLGVDLGTDSGEGDVGSAQDPTYAQTSTVPASQSAGPTGATGGPSIDGPSIDVEGPRTGDTDPESGLEWIRADDLPAQGRATLALVLGGGPFPCDKDGSTFGNFEGLLPQESRGYYAEFTVIDVCDRNRGALRIIAGDGGEVYWTADHYESFQRIAS